MLKAHAEEKAEAPPVPSMMPTTYVADQLAKLIDRPRRRLIIPASWRPVAAPGRFWPALADVLLPLFQAKEI